MIKVVEVIPTLGVGGAESMVRDYCNLLNKDKFEVSVIVLNEHKNSPIEKALEKNDINVLYMGEQLFKRNNLSVLQKAIRRISRYYYFKRTVMDLKPDVIHIHLQIGRYMRVLPLRRMDCKLFLTVHNVTWKYFSKDRKNKSRYKEYKEVNRLIHKYGLRLIALQDQLNQELKELFNTDSNNVITLHNGILMDRFNPILYDRIEERERLRVQNDEILIGHVGSMQPQKNHELILKIFSEYHKNNSASKLLLIGNGELKSQIVERIEQMGLINDVSILSDRDDVPQLMRAMDVFLFPSRWEGFGNVLIEAQSMGLPCIVSDAVPKDTRITNNVYVVGLNDPIDNWITAVKMALDGTEGVMREAEPQEYDMKCVVHKLERLYSNEDF